MHGNVFEKLTGSMGKKLKNNIEMLKEEAKMQNWLPFCYNTDINNL